MFSVLWVDGWDEWLDEPRSGGRVLRSGVSLEEAQLVSRYAATAALVNGWGEGEAVIVDGEGRRVEDGVLVGMAREAR